MATAPKITKTGKQDGAMASLVKAETAFQIALVLPAAVFLGWALGAGLDHWLHTGWIYMAGIVAGSVGGFIQMFRIANQLMKSSD
jgi:F0F1-type ATP synthase assembly protein I